jgi:hypothetical protein
MSPFGSSATSSPRLRPKRQRSFVGELQLARARRVPNGAGHVPAGEPEPLELVVWHEFLDQRKELSLLKPDGKAQKA